MTTPPDIGLIERLRDEADLCRNETAYDIAMLLDKAAGTIERLQRSLTASEKQVANLKVMKDQAYERCNTVSDEARRLARLLDECADAMPPGWKLTERVRETLEAYK